MSVRIVVPEIAMESLATEVINEGDTLVINNVSYPVIAVNILSGNQVEVICDGDVQPAVGAKIYIKESQGHIPLGTESVPGLVTKRVRSYMETPNVASTPVGVTTWNILDEDGVPASDLFEVGDWVRINNIEYLIQVVTQQTGAIVITTAPPAPTASASYPVYHYINAGIIPLATATTPGLVPHAYDHSIGNYTQIDLYLPGVTDSSGAPIATTTALAICAKDSFRWLGSPISVLSCKVKCAAADSGATPATISVRDVTQGIDITGSVPIYSSSWQNAPINSSLLTINTEDDIELSILGYGSNGDSLGIRVSLAAMFAGVTPGN